MREHEPNDNAAPDPTITDLDEQQKKLDEAVKIETNPETNTEQDRPQD